MWQELAVGLVVGVAALFLLFRVRKNVAAARTSNLGCGCDCSGCGQKAGASSECPEDGR